MSRTRNPWIAAILLASTLDARAQYPGGSTYWLHEQQRRQAIADQIGTQERMRWQSGLPSRLTPGRPYSLDSIYSGLAYSPGPWQTDVFEPWPFVPGDIYGRQFDAATPQPWGHRVTPLGHNGYVYEPAYEPPQPPPIVPYQPPPLVAPDLPRAQISPPAAPPPQAEEVPLPGSAVLREF